MTYRVLGDTIVEVIAPDGTRYSIQYVGIGHPWHTISEGRGRVSTGAEYALAKALIAKDKPLAVKYEHKGETLVIDPDELTYLYTTDGI